MNEGRGPSAGDEASSAPLIAVQATARMVRVATIEVAFGRVLCAAGSQLQSIQEWPGFLPLSVVEQVAGAALDLEESRAAEALVQTLAGAVARLATELGAERIRLALAMGSRVSPNGRDVEVLPNGPRVPGIGERLASRLQNKGVQVEGRMVGPLPMDSARVQGERHAPTGALVSGGDAVLLEWGDDAQITVVRGGEIRHAQPCEGAGLAEVEHEYRLAGGTRQLGVAARAGEALAGRLLAGAATTLAASAASELVDLKGAADSLGGSLVLTGAGAQLVGDARLAKQLRPPFERALGTASTFDLRISRLTEAPLLGAAAHALGLDRSDVSSASPDPS